MHRFFIPALLLILNLIGCEAEDSVLKEDHADALSAQRVGDFSRVVSLFLEPQQSHGFEPDINGRVIVSEPMYAVSVTEARALGQTDGISVVYVGESCESLHAKYQNLHDCAEEKTKETKYGEPESTATTNGQGYASIQLGDAAAYRLRVQSWPAGEDGKCYWGGDMTITENRSEIKIPLLVFCE